FFTGEVLPPCVQDPGSCDYGFATPELFPQFREGGPDLDGRREIVRYFVLPLDQEEGSGPAMITGEGQWLEDSGFDQQNLRPRAKLRGSSVALVATPGSPSTLRLALDGFGASTPVDAVDLRLAHLSLRVHLGARGTYQTPPVQTEEAITQACEDFAAQNAQDLRLRVTLYDASAGSETVFSDAYRRVAPTDIGTIVEGFSVACEAVGFWTTVRIPLQAFEPGVNLRELTTLELTVRSADHANLETGVLVDSVELVGHALDAVCGDGEAQGDESCDGADLGGETCPSLGFLGGGTLACTEHCTFDTAACIPGGGGEP